MSFETAWNTHDMKSLATLFRKDAEFINIVVMHWHGCKDIVAALTVFYETIFKNHHLMTDAIEFRPLGNGFAIASSSLMLGLSTRHAVFTKSKSKNKRHEQNKQRMHVG